jgi:hypothetical protein
MVKPAGGVVGQVRGSRAGQIRWLSLCAFDH